MPDEADRLGKIAAPHATVADKIRALSSAGVARADIARFLGKRYQHVRNVLEGDAQSRSIDVGQPGERAGYVLGQADLSGVQEQTAPVEPKRYDEAIEPRGRGVYWLRISQDGSLLLPDEFVTALGATPGRRVFTQLIDGAVRMISSEAAMEEARAIVRRHVRPGANIVDEFLAEKKAMWGETDD